GLRLSGLDELPVERASLRFRAVAQVRRARSWELGGKRRQRKRSEGAGCVRRAADNGARVDAVQALAGGEDVDAEELGARPVDRLVAAEGEGRHEAVGRRG